MENDGKFLDLYAILQVHPECDASGLEVAYRKLAKLYHPDHAETADIDKFSALVNAFQTLKDRDARQKYNHEYAEKTGYRFAVPQDDKAQRPKPLSDALISDGILKLLYNKRRAFPKDPGVGIYFLQKSTWLSDENIEFFLWYLKEKGHIRNAEDGSYVITVEGVDHVMSLPDDVEHESLLIAQDGAGAASRTDGDGDEDSPAVP